jgi:type 1 glutamine amidotransferase
MRNSYPIFLFVALLLVVVCACSSSRQLTDYKTNWKKVKVLVYTKNGKGYVHTNIPAANASLQQLGKEYGFNVDTSSNPAVFSDDNLPQYQAIVFNNTNNDVFDTDAQKIAFMRYIQAGGGFVGIHSASGTERNWPWFKRLLGGTFQRHANHQPFTEIIVDRTHPSTVFLPETWKRDDECYYVKEMNPKLQVLVVHDLTSVKDTAKPVFYGNTFPSVWCQTFDGGRSWYTSLGHDSATYYEKDFQHHIIGGLQWVIGKGTKLNYAKAHARTPNDPLPY